MTMRTSLDGYLWSPDAGCPGRIETACGDVSTCPTGYDTSGMIVPDPVDDPPELEFYLIKPFRIGTKRRLAAHALLYAPAPQELLGATYGLTGHNYKGPACTSPFVYNDTQCHGEPATRSPFDPAAEWGKSERDRVGGSSQGRICTRSAGSASRAMHLIFRHGDGRSSEKRTPYG